ncbi:MAG: aminopeptidase [Treponema sp.]|jgi:aminopeptidase|nr:aminopeptidase [Treponema sp.]
MDRRWDRLGELLVNYSARVVPGERVMIAMIEGETLPLVQSVYRAVIKAGGFPQVQFLSETLRHSLLRFGSAEQINWAPEIEAYGMEWADVYIGLRGAHNLYELAGVASEILAANQRAMGKISSLRWEKTRWCLVRVPNESFAQAAQTDYETILDMFFDSCFLDWENEAKKWAAWAEILNRGREIRITGRDTDLRFSVEGRRWVPFAGVNNMPDGEIATAPVNGTEDGHIYFEFPGVLSGRLVRDIRLVWEKGKLIRAQSSTEQDFFRSVLDKNDGAKSLGEFALGTNPFVTRFCNDILIDEKIGGTVHIALGRAYPECGGTNQSAIHWDIIKDTRKEGIVYLDGRPILDRGKITL